MLEGGKLWLACSVALSLEAHEVALMQDMQHNSTVRTTVTHMIKDLENNFVEI